MEESSGDSIVACLMATGTGILQSAIALIHFQQSLTEVLHAAKANMHVPRLCARTVQCQVTTYKNNYDVIYTHIYMQLFSYVLRTCMHKNACNS